MCKAHNNGLGHLDQAVVDQFDVCRFENKVPTKKGKSPEVNSRGNMVAYWEDHKPVILINTGRHPISIQDKRLGAFGGSTRNVHATGWSEGETGKMFFSFPLGNSPKFVRDIVKIAFSSLAYSIGPEKVLTDRFDPIRDFVLEGKGDRKIIWLLAGDQTYRNVVWAPINEAGDFSHLFPTRLCRVCCRP